MSSPPRVSWHSLSREDALQALHSQAHGLTSQEAAERAQTYGRNVMQAGRRISIFQRLLRQFHDPMVYVLLAAGTITAFLQHWTDTGVIAAVILLDALIGIIQEQKAEHALAAIRQLLSPSANVVRDGEHHLLRAEDLVPGDVVLLAAGDKVPADLRLLTANSLRTQEAILTGESFDVDKSVEAVAADTSLGERKCLAYSGTLVTAGQGTGVVVSTGGETEIGRISDMLGAVESPTTPLTRKLTRFSRVLAMIIVAVALAIFAFGIGIRGMPVSDMFMVMIAIAVAAIPEGLPAVISIALALGVRTMAGRNAIVRHLPVIEALGNATVICTDKTGTLTRNELAVTDIVTAAHNFHVTGVGYAPDGAILFEQHQIALEEYPALHALTHGAALNNDATLTLRKGVWELNGDPTEGALMAFALKAGHVREAVQAEWPRSDVIPFSAESRYMATLHHSSGGSGVIFVKGAPERLLSMCHMQKHGDEVQPLATEYWQAQIEQLARQGKRVLAIAERRTTAALTTLQQKDVESNLTLLGLFGIMDTPREEAKPAIAACLKAGITVKMITGDHVLTASAIGRMLGIPGSDAVMTGADMDRLSESALAASVKGIHIYARMHPEHKLKLIRALQAQGEIVAMTGDGVNDAPALKMADIGIAMGKQGTEVAKEASDLVLADDNFATIVHAVDEGRNIYRNIRRTIQFMLVTDGCEGLTLLVATLMGFTLPVTPLQILWVNMVTSVTLSLSFAFAPYDPDAMRRPPIPLHAPIFSRVMVFAFAWHVLIITAGTIGMFLQELHISDAPTARTIAVNVLVFFQIYYLWGLLLAQKKSHIGIRPYLPPLYSTLAIMVLQGLFTYMPWMQSIFGTVALPLETWLQINLVAAVIFAWIWMEYLLLRKMKLQ